MRHAPELRKQHLQVLPELRQAHVRVSFPPRGHLIDEHQDPRQQQDRQLVTDQQRIPRVRDLPQSLQQPGQHGAINAQLFFCCFLSRLLFFLDRLPFAFPVPDRSLPQRLETLRRLTFAQGARGLSAGLLLTLQLFSPPLLTAGLIHPSPPVEKIESPRPRDTHRSLAAPNGMHRGGPCAPLPTPPPTQSHSPPASNFPATVPARRTSPATPPRTRTAPASRCGPAGRPATQ